MASHGYKGLVQRDAVPEPQVDAEKFAESMKRLDALLKGE